jgi:hypothetical protein
MKDEPDPVRRWHRIRDFYVEFTAMPGYGFLGPMVGLANWVADQPMASRLYPSTSHEWLLVKLAAGYDPESPFFVAISRADGQFECELFAAVSEPVDIHICPPEEARTTFTNFVGLLERLSRSRGIGSD